jgi:hypothetical protein
MAIKAELVEENFKVRRYKVQYPISAYTFPKENLIHQAGFDDEFIHQDLRSLPSRKLNEAELELSTPFISIF